MYRLTPDADVGSSTVSVQRTAHRISPFAASDKRPCPTKSSSFTVARAMPAWTRSCSRSSSFPCARYPFSSRAGHRVRADPDRDHAVRLPGLPQEVPHPRALLHRGRRSPSPARPRRRCARRAPAPGPASSAGTWRTRTPRSTRRPRVTDADHVARARPPDPHRATRPRSRRTAAPSRRRAGGRRSTSGRSCRREPPVTTRNSFVAQAHDREVGLDAAGARSGTACTRRGPPARPSGATAMPCRYVSAPGPGHVEDRECRQVHHADAVAHRQVLGVDDRRPPARLPLGLARHRRGRRTRPAAPRCARTSTAAPSRPPRRTPRPARARAR